MRIVLLPLLLLMFASVLGVCRSLGYVDFVGNPVGSSFYRSGNESYSVNGTLIVGGNETVVSTEAATVGISAIVSAGIITLVVTSIALAVVSGVTVLGSGLNTEATKAIWKSAAYFGLWGLFSVFGLVLFGSIPVFGFPLYFLLTLFYSIGVLGSISGGV